MSNITTINQLINHLEHPDEEIREEAALKLAQIGSENVVEPLLKHLNDPSTNLRSEKSEIREMIIYGLGQTKSEKAIPSLVDFLKDPNFEVRWASAEALGEIGSKKALSPLLTRLNQEEVWNVQVSIVKSLAKIGSEEVIQPLIKLIQNDAHSFVKREAAYALVHLREINQKKQDSTILEYLMSGINNLVGQLHQDWQLITEQPALFGTMGNHNKDSPDTESRYLLRELQIEEKEYQLKIDYVKDSEGCPICRFQLTPKGEYEMIPKGFKIRLLTENLEDYPNNVKEAEQTQSLLEIRVKLEPDERIAWSIEPTPDNFKTEILPRFWNN